MNPKKRVWLIHSGAGRDLGGIETVNQEILDGWNSVSNLSLVPFHPGKNFGSIFKYIQGCFDHQITSTIFMHIGLSKFLLLGRPKGSIKVFLHGIEAWKKIPIWHKYLLRGVDHFISNSQFTWDRFLQFNPEFSHIRHDVVHLGIGEPIEYTESDSDIPAALIIGRMLKSEDYKGHRELISIWPQVRQRVPGAELWIVGTGDLQPELEQLANDHKGIRFYGKVSEGEKQELLRRCRCFAMPSRNEGFGLVYLEAMRLGRPCLVSDCDAGREVVPVPDCGLAIKLSDQAELVSALVCLLGFDRESALRRQNSSKVYGNNFTSISFLKRFGSSLNIGSV